METLFCSSCLVMCSLASRWQFVVIIAMLSVMFEVASVLEGPHSEVSPLNRFCCLVQCSISFVCELWKCSLHSCLVISEVTFLYRARHRIHGAH